MARTIAQSGASNWFNCANTSPAANYAIPGTVLIDPATGLGYAAGVPPAPGNVIVRALTQSLAAPLADVALNLGAIATLLSVTVLSYTGPGTATLKFGGAGETAIQAAVAGTLVDGLSNTNGLLINSDGAGGTMTFILTGRA